MGIGKCYNAAPPPFQSLRRTSCEAFSRTQLAQTHSVSSVSFSPRSLGWLQFSERQPLSHLPAFAHAVLEGSPYFPGEILDDTSQLSSPSFPSAFPGLGTGLQK